MVDKFPELRSRILDLTESDPDFRSTCEDYNRVCADLLRAGPGDETDRSISAELNRLREELEIEIAEMLNADF